jgi:hypothetical protein
LVQERPSFAHCLSTSSRAGCGCSNRSRHGCGWKQAGIAPAAGTKEFTALIAAWKRRRAYTCELLQSSTDWLKAAPSAPSELAAAALSAIRAADLKWPSGLFGEEVDIPCLLKIILEDVLALQHTNILADPNAKICLATDAAAGKGTPDNAAARSGGEAAYGDAAISNGAHAGPDSGGAAIDNGDASSGGEGDSASEPPTIDNGDALSGGEGDFSSEPPTSAAADIAAERSGGEADYGDAAISNGAHAGPDSGGAAIDNGDASSGGEGDSASEPPTSAAADSTAAHSGGEADYGDAAMCNGARTGNSAGEGEAASAAVVAMQTAANRDTMQHDYTASRSWSELAYQAKQGLMIAMIFFRVISSLSCGFWLLGKYFFVCLEPLCICTLDSAHEVL